MQKFTEQFMNRPLLVSHPSAGRGYTITPASAGVDDTPGSRNRYLVISPLDGSAPFKVRRRKLRVLAPLDDDKWTVSPEVGMRYVMRNGSVTGPLRATGTYGTVGRYPFSGDTPFGPDTWDRYGRTYYNTTSSRDLMALAGGGGTAAPRVPESKLDARIRALFGPSVAERWRMTLAGLEPELEKLLT